MKLRLCPICNEEVKHTSLAELERIHCEFCKLKMEDDVSCFALASRWNTRQSAWIRVKDSLPNRDETILMFNGTNIIINTGLNLVNFYTDATHWQPIPEPPKGE